MHRTVSMNYGVVLEDAVELELDLGEKRQFPRGDIFVQRGTTHLWRNPGESLPVRLLLIHLDSKEEERDPCPNSCTDRGYGLGSVVSILRVWTPDSQGRHLAFVGNPS